jgi:endonuclease YncB( thermonuclease family)
MRVLALLLLGTCVWAADTVAVVGVPAPDRVVIDYKGLPVAVPLALLEAPADAAGRKACQERLAALVGGQRVEVQVMAAFGADAEGAARVQLLLPKGSVNESLVAAGLARYQPSKAPDSGFDGVLRRAEEKARKAQLGLWAAAPAEPRAEVPVAAAAIPPPPPARPAKAAPTGRFASELDSPFFAPLDSPALAGIDPARLLRYPDEATARRAGKKPYPALARPPHARTEAEADAVFAQGEQVYAQAIAAGNSSQRDDLYAQAEVYFTVALQAYGVLADKRGDDEALGAKMQKCNQLRYGSIKQRRPAH